MSALEWRVQAAVRSIGRRVARLRTMVTGIAFWTGIITPFTYLMFVIPGLRSEARFTTLLVVIAIHCLALILGYPHRRSEG